MQLKDAITLLDHPDVLTTMPMQWADLGCGSGLFTQALSHMLAPGSIIFAVDKDGSALAKVKTKASIIAEKVVADFAEDDLAIGNLDGILMANSLHYLRDKEAFVRRMEPLFAARPVWLIVEYDISTGNRWVPYPESFVSMNDLFKRLGYGAIQKIAELPSMYQRGNIYAAIIRK